MDFTLAESLRHRDKPSFAKWLDAFLRGPGNNIQLADGLLRAPRWWIGPSQIALESLILKCGPGLEFHEDPYVWNRRTEQLSSAIRAGLAVPPLVAEYKNDSLILADGNHRCAALLQCGVATYWTAVWFNSDLDYTAYRTGNVAP